MMRYGCSGCDVEFEDWPAALRHRNQIGGHNIFTIRPQAARPVSREERDFEEARKEPLRRGRCAP